MKGGLVASQNIPHRAAISFYDERRARDVGLQNKGELTEGQIESAGE